MIDDEEFVKVNGVNMTTWSYFGANVHLVNTMEDWRAFYELLRGSGSSHSVS